MPSQRSFATLAERESARGSYSMVRHPKAPEEIFYSIQQSRKHASQNRYSNIYAYDRTAVRGPGVEYLNANVVTDGKGGWWIAAQAPKPSTFETFFRAIESRLASSHPLVSTPNNDGGAIIVQLTGWEENGMIKADRYFANDSTLASEVRTTRHDDLSADLSELRVGSMSVWHYHFDAWPDHGVPKGEAVQALIRLVKAVEAKRREQGDCEVWIHCSAGVGRSGTFIALSSLLRPGSAKSEGPLGPLPSELRQDNIAVTVDAIRECRGYLVQNQDQLQLLYDIMDGRS